MHWTDIPAPSLKVLRQGAVFPAHLLALDAQRRLDLRRQRALTRYYLDAGAGGVAVGVHSTQFAIRDQGMYKPVLELAMQTANDWTPLGGQRALFMIAGLAGGTAQARNEARVAKSIGYQAGLLSLAAMNGASEDELIDHCRAVADIMPLVGFYLQPAVGGLHLSTSFWKRFAALDNVVAVKIAPFNRYRTLDVIRGVIDAYAEDRVTLYTGNDDHIVLDLLCPFTFLRDGIPVTVKVMGGLLGHWSVGTCKAVEQLALIHSAVNARMVTPSLLELDAQVTDCNSALFDPEHDFSGCIAGCHEVLRRQGLLEGIWCLDPQEGLSVGQADNLTRVHNAYPHLHDDAFVARHLHRWMAD